MRFQVDNRIKLLVLSRSLFGGGAEKFVSNLISEIDLEKYNIILVLFRDELGFNLPDDVEVVVLGRYGVLDEIGSIKRLCAVIDKYKPDILLSNIAYTNRIAGIAKIFSKHTYKWIAVIGSAPSRSETVWMQKVMRFLYRNTDQIVSVSANMVAEIELIYPTVKEKVRVIYNGAGFFQKSSARKVEKKISQSKITVLWVSRLASPKRPDIVVKAFAKLCRNYDVELIICGDGPLQASLIYEIEKLDIADRVIMYGFVDDPYNFLVRSDVFVFSSEYEGLGTAIVEAQVCGLPVVATDCKYGPNEVVVDGKTGFIVPVNDVEKFSEKLENLISDKELRQEMSDHAISIAIDKFSNKVIYKEWEDLFDELAGE